MKVDRVFSQQPTITLLYKRGFPILPPFVADTIPPTVVLAASSPINAWFRLASTVAVSEVVRVNSPSLRGIISSMRNDMSTNDLNDVASVWRTSPPRQNVRNPRLHFSPHKNTKAHIKTLILRWFKSSGANIVSLYPHPPSRMSFYPNPPGPAFCPRLLQQRQRLHFGPQ